MARRASYEVFKTGMSVKTASGEGDLAASELTKRIKATASSGQNFETTHDFMHSCGLGSFWDKVSNRTTLLKLT